MSLIGGWNRRPALVLGGGLAAASVVGYYYANKLSRSRDLGKETQLSSAYIIGVGSGLVTVGTFFVYRRLAFPNPNSVITNILPSLRANPEVRSYIGSDIRSGLFKAYLYTGGMKWFRYDLGTLQVLFQMIGEQSSAMVTVEVLPKRKEAFQNKYNTLIVDFANGQRLLLKGTSNNIVFKGYKPFP